VFITTQFPIPVKTFSITVRVIETVGFVMVKVAVVALE
jgi:hypothetical protein